MALAFAPARSIGLDLAARRDSRTHYAKGKRSPIKGSHSFVGTRFQVSFTPLAGVLFTFPSRYLSTIGHHRVFRLGGWAPRIPAGFHVSRGTWEFARLAIGFGYGAFTRSGRTFQTVLLPISQCHVALPQPQKASLLVWPLPISLATTHGISIDVFSSGY